MLSLFDWLLPKHCVGCHREGSWLCISCLEAIRQEPARPCCPFCDTATISGEACPMHQAEFQLDGLISVGLFHKGILRNAIHTLKYEGVTELSQPLGALLKDRLAQYDFLRDAVIIPLPLHPKRQRERGFNQAELLARQLPGYQSRSILVRHQERPPQAKLSHEQRRQNSQGIFGVRRSKQSQIKGRTVVIVDDVCTTGSTLNQAAAVVKRAGATQVWGAVLAKG